MVRVMFVEFKDFYGGGQVFLKNLAKGIHREEFESYVVSVRNSRLEEALKSTHVSHYQMRLGRIQNTRNLFVLFRNVLERVVPTARLIRFIRKHSIDMVCANDLYSYLASYGAAALTRTPVVLVAHMSSYSDNLFLKFILRSADRIVAVSEAVRARLVAFEPACAPKAVTIENGVEMASETSRQLRDSTRTAWGVSEGGLVVGMVGRLSHEKGADVFLQAAAELLKSRPTTKFVLVGEGPEEQKTRENARSLGIESSVVFAGFRDDVSAVLAAIDIVVIPSRTEGLPLILLEAMSSGKPVVATNTGGIPDVLQEGVNGRLLPAADPLAFARAIAELLDDPSARHRMGMNARKTAEGRFSVDRMIEAYERVFFEVEFARR